MWRFALVLMVFVGVLLKFGDSRVLSAQESTRFPSARAAKDGDKWLGWDKSRRLGFVAGFQEGNRAGHYSGCDAAMDIFLPNTGPVVEPPSPEARCLEKLILFPKEDAYYVEQITTLYERYPPEREIPLPVVMQLLSDQMNKTADGIHQCYVSGPLGRCKPNSSAPKQRKPWQPPT